MLAGKREYSTVIATLEGLGLPSEFTQTGGMNAAIVVQLETGETLLITDEEDSLAWRIAEKRGWAVGRYPPEGDSVEDALAFVTTPNNSLEALLSLIDEIMLPRALRGD